jgi:hypothetical protein
MLHHSSLGRVAGKARAIIKAYEEGSGPASCRAELRALDALAVREGFMNFGHLAEIIRLRTSDRWVYFNLGVYAAIDEEPTAEERLIAFYAAEIRQYGR